MRSPNRVGLIPAAGRGTRLGALPFSKEILPVDWDTANGQQTRPVAVIEKLIRSLRVAGATRTFVVLRTGKWDIPAYLGDGGPWDMSLGYVMMRHPHGQPFSLDAAYPFLGDATVLLGYPDILIEPEDAHLRVADHLESSSANIVLGLFPVRDPEKTDMVELDSSGSVSRLVVKPADSTLRYTWMVAAWDSSITEFLHRFVLDRVGRGADGDESAFVVDGRELYMGDVFTAAITEGFKVEPVVFDDGRYIDIGTPDDLREVLSGWKG